ncbi:MAG: TIR domain-containing protein [Burkholderiaceae bacterium]
MADLFVSYSREDQARAEQIVRLLEDHGWDVFWDQETRAGTLWPKVLEDELNSARCLVALWTTTSIESRWVRIEAYEALQSEKLVPVMLDKVRPPLEFRQTQTFDLVGWSGDRDDSRIAHLLSDLTALVKAPVPPAGGSRPIKLMVPTTVVPQKAASAGSSTIGSERPTAPAAGTAPNVERIETGSTAWQRLTQPPAPYRGPFIGVAVATAVGVLAWSMGAFDPSRESTPALVPSPTPPISDAVHSTPAPVGPTPVNGTTIAVGPTPTVPDSKPPVKSTVKPAPKPARSSRCLAIDEKFQQTGQITSTERDLLRSKECQS